MDWSVANECEPYICTIPFLSYFFSISQLRHQFPSIFLSSIFLFRHFFSISQSRHPFCLIFLFPLFFSISPFFLSLYRALTTALLPPPHLCPHRAAPTTTHPSPLQWKECDFQRKRYREMGTREVYQEKLKRGNLYHDPTINPGLGSPRCPRCLSLLNPNSDKGEWTITSVLHDATTVAGSGIGGMLSAVHGFNTGIPYLQNCFRGPKWLPFVAGVPLLLVFSCASAAFGGYALPKFSQLTITSYYTASSASHYGISLLTRHIEQAHTSQTPQERLR